MGSICQVCKKEIMRDEPRYGVVYADKETYEECYNFFTLLHTGCVGQIGTLNLPKLLSEEIETDKEDVKRFVENTRKWQRQSGYIK